MDFFTDPKFFIPAVISIIALFNSFSAKSKATESSKRAYDLEQRLEVFQYFPIIEPDIIAKENKLCVVLRNNSGTNSSPLCTVKYVLRINSLDTHSIDAEDKFEVENVLPHSTREEVNEKLNSFVEDGISFLQKADPKDTHFVFRIWVTYTAPHPDAKSTTKEIMKYFQYIDGALSEKINVQQGT